MSLDSKAQELGLPTLKEFKDIYSLPFYTKIWVGEIYDTVLKEQGFDIYGQPKRSCKNPDITAEEMEYLAYEKYLSDDFELEEEDEDEDEDEDDDDVEVVVDTFTTKEEDDDDFEPSEKMFEFQSVDAIKTAVDSGKTVYWSNSNYQIVISHPRSYQTEYLIKCLDNDSCIGLTWRDGKTLNGKLKDFYTINN
tara:strand:+ start:161 stop:739 length:579 start_codon:yes stop_codon:yes gene_type:complete